MMDFLFRRKNDPPSTKVIVHISGPLLDQLRSLKPGQVLQLGAEDGECYAAVRWEDIVKGARLGPQHYEGQK